MNTAERDMEAFHLWRDDNGRGVLLGGKSRWPAR